MSEHEKSSEWESRAASRVYRRNARLKASESFAGICYSVEDENVPEKTMWAACLVQAFTMGTTTLGTRAGVTDSGRHIDDVWFKDTSTEPGSYLYICEVLDICPKRTYEKGMLLRESEVYRKAGNLTKKVFRYRSRNRGEYESRKE